MGLLCAAAVLVLYFATRKKFSLTNHEMESMALGAVEERLALDTGQERVDYDRYFIDMVVKEFDVNTGERLLTLYYNFINPRV